MVGVLSFLWLLSVGAFILAIIFLVIRAAKKQRKKPFVIMASSTFILSFVLMMLVGLLYEPSEKSMSTLSQNTVTDQSEPKSSDNADKSALESDTDTDIKQTAAETESTDRQTEQEKGKKEQAEKEATEKAEQEAKQKAEREAEEKEKAELERAEKEKAEKKAKEKAEREKAEKEKREKERVEKEKQKEVQKEKNKRKEIKSAIKEIVGADSLESFNYVPDNNFSLIKFKGSDNLTTNMTIKGMYLDIFDILKAIQPIIDTDVDFNVTYPLQDRYGNVKDVIVIKATFTNETINKINFDNVLWENTPDLADEWWNHDAVRLTN